MSAVQHITVNQHGADSEAVGRSLAAAVRAIEGEWKPKPRAVAALFVAGCPWLWVTPRKDAQ